MMKFLIITLALINLTYGNAAYPHLQEYSTTTTTTPPPPPRPYSFKYEAGRYPGQIDRIHKESSDGSGTVYGSYSYIDPKYKVRTVEYVVDDKGFHPSLINYEDLVRSPVDSEAVQQAKIRHHELYEKIASAHAQGAPANLPKDSASVARAKNRHFELFEKISQEHAAIAAQREAERLAFEATSIPNDVEEHQKYNH